MPEDQLTLDDITPDIENDDGAIATAPEDDPLFSAPKADEKKEKSEDTSPQDVIAQIEPRHEPVDVTLSYSGLTQTYSQKPLTFFGKMEFMRLVGQTLDEATKGEDGLKINELLGDELDMSELAGGFGDLDSFLGLISKIARYAPDFLKECYLVWLNVPMRERAWARDALNTLPDEEAFEILERFIDQNWEALESFLLVKLASLIKRVRERRQKD